MERITREKEEEEEEIEYKRNWEIERAPPRGGVAIHVS